MFILYGMYALMQSVLRYKSQYEPDGLSDGIVYMTVLHSTKHATIESLIIGIARYTDLANYGNSSDNSD